MVQQEQSRKTDRACLILRKVQNVLPKSLAILRRQGLYHASMPSLCDKLVYHLRVFVTTTQ